MNARTELNRLYAQWRALSEAEGAAIRGGVWEEMARCQGAKQALQSLINGATDRWHAEESGAAGAETFRPVVNELIQLEQRNAGWLQARRREAERERQQLTQSSQNLRQIHRTYGAARPPGHWESFS